MVGINPTRRGTELAADIRGTGCAVIVTDDAYGDLLDGIDHGAPQILDSSGAEYAGLLAMHRGAAVETCDDVAYNAMPIFHGNALMSALDRCRANGAAFAMRRRFSASGFLPDIRRFGATCRRLDSLEQLFDIAYMGERPSWWSYANRCHHGHEWGPGLVMVGWMPCEYPEARAENWVFTGASIVKARRSLASCTATRPPRSRPFPSQELVTVMPSPTSRSSVASVIRWVRSFATAQSPGSKAGQDPASVHRTPGRLVAVSDAVFAITVTLLVLEIRPPTDYTNLLPELAALWPSYLAYALTFLFIGQVWANHHVMFDNIRVADRVILLLNTLLLMIVAFLPFVTSVLAGALRSGHGLPTAVALYGFAFDSTALTFNAVWQYAGRHRLLSETLDPAGATAIGRRFQLALVWLTAGALLSLLVPFLGVAMIAAFNVFYWLPIRGESPRASS